MKVMARPRTRSLTTPGSSRSRSAPLNQTSPPRMRAAPAGSTPRMTRASVVLPQPLSPTRPTTSPRPTSRLMASSTCATPPSVTKSTLSPRTERSSGIARGAAAAQAGVEDVAQPVAEQVEGPDGEEDREAERRRALHEDLFLQRARLRIDDAREPRPVRGRQREDDVGQRGPERLRDRDGEHHLRHREEDVGHAHEQVAEPAVVVAAQQNERNDDEKGGAPRDHAEEDR